MDLFGVCPHVTAQRIFAGKWTILIYQNLVNGPRRFGDLQRNTWGITQAALTKQLRLLESLQLVRRHIYLEIPPKVEYSLTELGKEALPVMTQLKIFGDKYIEYLKTVESEGQKASICLDGLPE
jgi:DNA-binding HxlR family transcriptional regulator